MWGSSCIGAGMVVVVGVRRGGRINFLAVSGQVFVAGGHMLGKWVLCGYVS